MGQGEIINLLIKEKKPLGRNQIAKALCLTPIKVSMILRVLLKHNEVMCIELDRNKARKFLGDQKIQRRTKIYYIEE